MKKKQHTEQKQNSFVNFIKYIAIGVALSIAGVLYSQFIAGKPAYMEKANSLKEAGGVQTFNLKFDLGKQDIGFVVNGNDFAGHRLNGIYKIEFMHDGKLVEKRVINKETIKDKELYIVTMGRDSYSRMPLDVVSIPLHGKYYKLDVKITVLKSESVVKRMSKDLYFYKDKHNKGIENIVTEDREFFRNLNLYSTMVDSNESNVSLKPFHDALLLKDFKKIKEFVENDNNFSVHTKMLIDRNSAHYAAFNNDIKTLKYLIEKGVDIHHKDKLDKIPLVYAIETLSVDTARILLENDAKIREIEYVGNYFVDRNYPYDVDENETYIHKRSSVGSYKLKIAPLNYAVSRGSYEMTKILLEHNATNNRESRGKGDKYLIGGGWSEGIYSHLYSIQNYKDIFNLLHEYNIPDIVESLPTKKKMGSRYEKCKNRGFDGCEDLKKVLNEENMNIYFYLENVHFVRKENKKRRDKRKELKQNNKGEK